VGRHASIDGAGSHPLVADALGRRTVPAPRGTHRGEANVTAPQSTSSVGWPAPPGRGEGLGWPGEPDTAPTGDDGSLLAALDAAQDSPAEVPTPRRSGWRRFFGGGHSSTTSAA